METQQKPTKGSVIRDLRKAKNLTQAELAEGYGICSERYLRDIELGIKDPSEKVLNKILKALDTPREVFDKLLYGNDMLRFKSDFDELWDMGYKKDFKTLARKLDVLKAQPYCNMELPKIRQDILLLEALLQCGLNKEYRQGMNKLLTALKITVPQLVTKDGHIECDYLKEEALQMNEYRIVKIVAILEENLGNMKEAIELTLALVESLEGKDVYRDVQKKLLPSSYYNAINALIESGRYTDALDMADDGISFCQRFSEPKELSKLVFTKGIAFYKCGDIEQATTLFKDACSNARFCGDLEREEMFKAYAKNKCAILL